MELPNEIYLFEGDDGVVWCDTDESDSRDAVKYVKADRAQSVEEAYSEAIAIQDFWDSDMVNWFVNKTQEKPIREHIRNLYHEFKQLESRKRLRPKQTLNDIKSQTVEDAILHLKDNANLVSSENLKQYANTLRTGK